MIELKYSTPFVASSVFGFLTLILYIIVIRTLIVWRKVFKTTYYKFFIASAILCILSYLDSWPILILPNAVCKGCSFSDFYEQGTFPGLNILRYFYVYLNHAINFIEILMVFNRYTAIALHFRYKKIWSKFSYYPLILVFAIPLGLTYSSLFSNSFAYYREQFDSYAITSDESISRRKLTAAASMFCLTLSVIIFGGMTLYALCKHSVFADRSTEAKLFIHAMIIGCNGTFAFIYGALSAYFPLAREINESDVTAYTLLLNTCISPYILVLCSKQLRDRLPIFSRRNKTPVTQISSFSVPVHYSK